MIDSFESRESANVMQLQLLMQFPVAHMNFATTLTQYV